MHHGVIFPEIMPDETHVHVVVAETSKKCRWFVWMVYGLHGSVWVSLFDSVEVVMCKVGNGIL